MSVTFAATTYSAPQEEIRSCVRARSNLEAYVCSPVCPAVARGAYVQPKSFVLRRQLLEYPRPQMRDTSLQHGLHLVSAIQMMEWRL